MNYIGSKYKLSDFIKNSVTGVVGDDLSDKILCDLFAGTGTIGRSFKSVVKKVIANDLEYYSYVLNRNYIGNNITTETSRFFQELNSLSGVNGFIYKNYCTGGQSERQYFSDHNGLKIDAARIQIENWKTLGCITENTYYFLLTSLLESADKVANTASVYGSFLKGLKGTAKKKLQILPALFQETKNSHQVFNQNSNKLINDIEGDILYLDPPYNSRQYGANYHMLNTIAKYDTFVPIGKTGLRSYNRSDYCKKKKVAVVFEELIKNSSFKYIFLSYNNEGLMDDKEIRKIMKQYGRYDLVTTDYKRFKTNKTNSQQHKANETIEYLHILEK